MDTGTLCLVWKTSVSILKYGYRDPQILEIITFCRKSAVPIREHNHKVFILGLDIQIVQIQDPQKIEMLPKTVNWLFTASKLDKDFLHRFLSPPYSDLQNPVLIVCFWQLFDPWMDTPVWFRYRDPKQTSMSNCRNHWSKSSSYILI